MTNIKECPPILICAFNRPDCLQQVFNVVKNAKPAVLFLALDAPRNGRTDDLNGWQACKEIFDTSIDWPCDVKRDYATQNMGCRERMVTAITWAFSFVDRAIILEDDVVADASFFPYCGELLERYKDDNRIGMIAGHDEHLHLGKLNFYGDSYYFDRMGSITGWATWRRAWQCHDPEMKYWPELSKRCELFRGLYRSIGYTRRRIAYNWKLFHRETGAWAGVWCLTMIKENWLCIHPTVNLISHVGNSSSRDGANRVSPFDNRPRKSMKFPLSHPISTMPRCDCEYYYFSDVWNFHYVINRLKNLPRSLVERCIKAMHTRRFV